MFGAAPHPTLPTTPRAHASMRGCRFSAAKWSSPTLRALAAGSGPNAGNGPGRAPTCAAGQGDAVVYGSYVDEVIAFTSGSGASTSRYYVHSNHLWSPAAITDSTGAVVERYTYNATGRQTITSSGGAVRSKSAVGFDRSLTGYIRDDETGLLHARERMFSPTLGRFISRDRANQRAAKLGGNHRPDGFDVSSQVGFRFSDENQVRVKATGYLRRGTMFVPAAGDGYQDGMNLYFAYFLPNDLDPTGNTIWVCIRKTACLIGNHKYLYDDRAGANPRSCGRPAPDPQRDLPPGSEGTACVPVPGSEGHEQEIMDYCRDHANDGMYFPLVNDCHDAADAACRAAGLTPPQLRRTGPVGTDPPVRPVTRGGRNGWHL